MDTINQFSNTLGRIDDVWETIHSSREWGQYPTEHVIRFVARNYYKKERRLVKILDCGVGGGAHTWYLAREGFDTYGFDGSPSAVEKVKSRLIREKLTAHILCASGQEVEYDFNFFDAVIDNFCIYSNKLNDIVLMYKKAYSYLKKNGKLLSAVFGKKTTGYGLGKQIEKDTYTDITEGPLVNRGKTHFFSSQAFVSLLEDVGFINIKCEECLYTDDGNTIDMLIAACEK